MKWNGEKVEVDWLCIVVLFMSLVVLWLTYEIFFKPIAHSLIYKFPI